jgi:hypothetical protein
MFRRKQIRIHIKMSVYATMFFNVQPIELHVELKPIDLCIQKADIVLIRCVSGKQVLQFITRIKLIRLSQEPFYVDRIN